MGVCVCLCVATLVRRLTTGVFSLNALQPRIPLFSSAVRDTAEVSLRVYAGVRGDTAPGKYVGGKRVSERREENVRGGSFPGRQH